MSAIAGRGQRPTSPEPIPKRADPTIRRASIDFAVGRWEGLAGEARPTSRRDPGGDEGDHDRAAHHEGDGEPDGEPLDVVPERKGGGG